MTASSAPRLSVVLATDTYETIRPVVARLRRQTVAEQIEIVMVAPAAGGRDPDWSELGRFAGVRTVDVPSPLPLGAARAAGVRAASAPLVFIGETHTYPHPGWAEALIKAFEQPWVAVVPAIGNANPNGVASWAAYLSDYAKWADGRPAGALDDPLVYNTAYRRSALLQLGDRLGPALDPYAEELWPTLHGHGNRAGFEPTARIDHLNVARPGPYFQEKFLAGLLIGASRSRRWSWGRRILYVLGSPLIPVVLVARLLTSVRRVARTQRLPAGTIAVIAAGAVAKSVGEVIGYLGAAPSSTEARMTEIELHKVKYAARRAR